MLGRPGTGAAAGPELQSVGAPVPEVPTLPPLYEAGAASGATVQGDGWQALAADGYTELAAAGVTKPWRAVTGTPLWARQDVLVTLDGADALVYVLLER